MVETSMQLHKRISEGHHWFDFISQKASKLLSDLLYQVKIEDPVKGQWRVPDDCEGIVWCDASKIGLGAMLEIGLI